MAAQHAFASNSPTRLLTLEEVMHRTSMRRTFIYSLVQKGELRRAKIGRNIRFVESDVEAWVQGLIKTSSE